MQCDVETSPVTTSTTHILRIDFELGGHLTSTSLKLIFTFSLDLDFFLLGNQTFFSPISDKNIYSKPGLETRLEGLFKVMRLPLSHLQILHKSCEIQ